MNFAKSIRIFLADGTPTGLRTIEISNWTGICHSIYRNKIEHLQARDDIYTQGVYLLIGPDDKAPSGYKVYVGEAESTGWRIRHHMEKEFWNQLLIFSSKDDNLTKSHVKYLEAAILESLIEVNQVEIANSKTSNKPGLPEAEIAMLEEFLYNLKLIIGTIGFASIFEQKSSDEEIEGDTFLFKHSEDVRMKIVDTGYLVLAGSTISKDLGSSFGGQVEDTRSRLIKQGNLIEEDGKFVLKQDTLFSSPSAAAMFVSGRSSNGRWEWKTTDGQALKEWEENKEQN